MRNRMKKYRNEGAILLCFLLAVSFSLTAMAENLPCRSATATGLYRDPSTGAIEDSGGEDGEALGQSMVTNVVDPDALIEENPSGGYYLSLRFHLMNNLSDIRFSVQEPEESGWKEVPYVQTGSAEDQGDFRFPINSEDAIVRAECYVEAMGRSVIFFVIVDDFEEGNRGGFAQTDSSDASGGTASGEAAFGSDALEGVTGLTTGGSNTAAAQTASANLDADISGTEELQVQQLNLSGSVWWMLFVVIFCGNVLSGLVLLGAKRLLDYFLGRRPYVPEDDQEEENEEPGDMEDMELLIGDWEEDEDEEA